ncbi:MAG: hypothetical protein V4650_15545 [Pseudomonadota bacterium]
MHTARRSVAALLTLLLAPPAGAHSFGKLYNLPVPLWLYLYGAVAALLLSFLVMAWLASQPAAAGVDADPEDETMSVLPRWLRHLLQAGALGLLALAIVSGLFGSQDAYANFNMSGFWIGFVLGFAYLVALVGPLYAVVNPWRLMVGGLERFSGPWLGHVKAPERLGVLPALLLYLAFIWVELFGGTGPRQLSWLLIGYTGVNLTGAWWFGSRYWFAQGEFFAVFMRLLGRCSPLVWRRDGVGLQWPFAGLLRERAAHWSLLLFVLFMLSSTAFDGLRETVPWVSLYWQDLHTLLWSPLFGEDRIASYPRLVTLYAWWQGAALLLSPFAYLAVYLACLQAALWLTRSSLSLKTLALRFAPTLIPIALVYHLTHYYTLLFTQGAQLPWLLADPLGTGSEWAWRWLGLPRAYIPDAGVVWHTQVGLIVAGHIVSVVLAHRVALALFASRREATLSQLPMLLLMMLYTGGGLWILAQPLNPGAH